MSKQSTTTRNVLLATLLAGAAHAASADITVTVLEVANDVVWTASGSADLSGLPLIASSPFDPICIPNQGFTVGAAGPADIYSMAGANFAGPGSFGTGSQSHADSGTGDISGPDFALPGLLVPDGYASGTPLSGTATYANRTLASLGLTEGAYTWTWDTATGTDSITLLIGTPLVSNTTQGTQHFTLQDALDNANNGDAIAIAAGTLFEDNIQFPRDLSVTVTGAGMDQTIIDGGGAANPQNAILRMVELIGSTNATVTVSDLTLQNGHADNDAGGTHLGTGVDADFTRVRFQNNSGSEGAHALINGAGTSVTMRRCIFTGGSGFDGILNFAESVLLTNCLFYDNNTTDSAIWTQMGTNPTMATVVNCTIDHPIASAVRSVNSAQVNLTNSVLIGSLIDSSITTSHCLSTSVSAGNGNIVGSPNFVDAASGDYRLDPGSLGIDAADSDAYANAGGGFTDLGGNDRTSDASTPDTGVGFYTALDMGAYEFQAQPGTGCTGDIDGDGDADPDDINAFVDAFLLGCP